MTRTLKLTLAYDGTRYSGWQSQPNKLTVQGELEQALAKITGADIRIIGSGRTDAGVHALGQVVSFSTSAKLSAAIFQRALNGYLPHDIAVTAADEAPPQFHAIADALWKTYRYLIHDGTMRDVFRRAYCWQYKCRLDAEAMHRAAQPLVGTHDFRSFESHWPTRSSSVRTIRNISVRRGHDNCEHLIALEVTADGFLYNMVRTITGTLVDVGRGAQAETWPAEVVKAGDRTQAGMTALPQGLYLVRVDYDQG
jgi:tRNA pseudouridine38-40 synthase